MSEIELTKAQQVALWKIAVCEAKKERGMIVFWPTVHAKTSQHLREKELITISERLTEKGKEVCKTDPFISERVKTSMRQAEQHYVSKQFALKHEDALLAHLKKIEENVRIIVTSDFSFCASYLGGAFVVSTNAISVNTRIRIGSPGNDVVDFRRDFEIAVKLQKALLEYLAYHREE